jgi:hypothetical protein
MAWGQGRQASAIPAPASLIYGYGPADRVGGPPAAAENPAARRRDTPAKKPPSKHARRRQKSAAPFGRLIYWGAVLALWAI